MYLFMCIHSSIGTRWIKVKTFIVCIMLSRHKKCLFIIVRIECRGGPPPPVSVVVAVALAAIVVAAAAAVAGASSCWPEKKHHTSLGFIVF